MEVVHPCKRLLKARDDVQGARSSQRGLDSLFVTKSEGIPTADASIVP